jgi:ABC-type multidrug transport system fused ATPase/permease subunit
MFKTFRQALEFMGSKERSRYFFFLGLRAFVAVFDLIGILAIGFLATSIALFVTLGSDATRVIEFAGQRIPAITAGTLPFVSGTILMLFIVKAVLSILLTRQLALFLAGVEARAAREVADRAFGNGLEHARRLSRDEVYFAVQGGSPAAFNSILNAVGTIAAEGLLIVFVIGSFLVVDPPSAIGALAYFGLIALVIQYFIGTKLQRTAAEVVRGSISGDQAIGDLSEVLREATVYGSKEFFFQKIFDARSRTASNLASQHTLSAMPRYIVETALIIAVALFVLVQASSGDLVKAAGTVGIFLSGGLRLTASLLPLQGALLSIRQSMPIAERALSLLEQDGKTASRPHVSTPVSLRPKDFEPVGVEMKNVSFGFIGASQFAIRNINLRVEAGQQVALIGPSGAGKSTIADLILGLLTPTSGEISVDGLSPRVVILETPGRLAYVPQRPGIISGTVTENIAMGSSKGDLDLVRLESAIKNSHLEEVLEALPDGVESNVGKRKDELSGGQLQRIGLARALYSRPGLLIMDEATSALDAESENEINKALDEMRGRTTVVLIAHRLNTVQRSDLVFLVEDGQITASGKFPDLLKSNKTVQKLAELMSIDSNNS